MTMPITFSGTRDEVRKLIASASLNAVGHLRTMLLFIDQQEAAEREHILSASSVGNAKLQGEILRLTEQRDRAWALLRELGVTVMP